MIVNKYSNGGGGGGSYTLPTATASRLGGIKVGSGLTVENDGTLSTSGEAYVLPVASQNTLGGIKVGTGLSIDSGGTVSVSGGTGGGPAEYYLNDMSQQELAALYAEISGVTGGDNDAGDALLSDYRFYIYSDVDGQKWSEAFFSNWEEVEGEYDLWIHSIKPPKASYPCGVMRTWACIHSDGQVGFDNDELTMYDVEDAARDLTIQIDSQGNIIGTDNLASLSNLSEFNRIQFFYQNEDLENHYSSAPLDYFHREMNDDDELIEHIGCTINIDGVIYRGRWTFAEWGWGDDVAPESWEAVAGYVDLDVDITDMKNPKLLPNEDGFYEYSGDTNVRSFVLALAGGYSLSEKPVRIHLMQDDGEGGYEDAGYPVQYGRIVKSFVVGTEPVNVELDVEFNLSVVSQNDATYRIKFFCTLDDFGVLDCPVGIMSAQEVPRTVGEYLLPVDAWISIHANAYLSGSSIYSLEKFAYALANDTTANHPLVHYDDEYDSYSHGDIYWACDLLTNNPPYIDFTGHSEGNPTNTLRWRITQSGGTWTMITI